MMITMMMYQQQQQCVQQQQQECNYYNRKRKRRYNIMIPFTSSTATTVSSSSLSSVSISSLSFVSSILLSIRTNNNNNNNNNKSSNSRNSSNSNNTNEISYSQRQYTYAFLPDFTEHPKPKIQIPIPKTETKQQGGGAGGGGGGDDNENENEKKKKQQQQQQCIPETVVVVDEITFVHDFIAGGVAGMASVIVGHPFDTIKVRLQTSGLVVSTASTTTTSTSSILKSIQEYGGISSLFRGMTAPLCAAAFINATVFGSYGFSSRLYDKYITNNNNNNNNNNNSISTTSNIDSDNDDTTIITIPIHDSGQKSFLCGSFAGLIQSVIICPLEHIKCRLQTQASIPASKKGMKLSTSVPITTTVDYYYGPIDAVQKITKRYGIRRLYQGWWSTIFREVPAFGLYFCTYDYLKDITNQYLIQYYYNDTNSTHTMTTHTWIASAIAGGLSGSFTWAIVYPIDVIKSYIQTTSLSTPYSQLHIWYVGRTMIQKYGISYLFRGLNITLIRAVPVNGTIFPVYEFTLQHITALGY